MRSCKLKFVKLALFIFLLALISCDDDGFFQEAIVKSPNGKIEVRIMLDHGRPFYTVDFADKQLIAKSELGFRFKRDLPLDKNFKLIKSKRSSYDKTWEQSWGEVKSIRNNYNEIKIFLKEVKDPYRKLNIIYRIYNDGVGFRYEIPEQDSLKEFEITSEKTEFSFTGNHKAWWIPADYDSYEFLYNTTSLLEVSSANTPITFETNNGVHISIHEANLTDYAGMTLKANTDKEFAFKSVLCPWPDGVKVKTSSPMVTPWRTIQITENAGQLIESNIILNLNEPNKLEDTSWIKPLKYIGIWWEMHLGMSTWRQGENHGATTEHTKELIDFASEYGIDAVLVEGWNIGWETWGNYSYITPYDDYDLNYLVEYAHENGVKIIMHNETGGEAVNYEEQIDEAYSLYESLGINSIKTGYVGVIDPGSYHHHGQWMVNHYRRVLKKAAKHKIMLNIHEPIKPTGIRRTYPNRLTGEGVRGMEWNAFNTLGNSPEHTTIIPFTRMLAGPIDYTPGIFDLLFTGYQGTNRVRTTLAKQLALYVVIYSPMQMAADLIDNYKDNPAFKFIQDVPVDWHDTKVLNAKIGDFVTIARRNKDCWYIGSITDENAKEFVLPLTFLEPGKLYKATIYADAPDASYENNPHAITINEVNVDNSTVLNVKLATSGGQAISIEPVE